MFKLSLARAAANGRRVPDQAIETVGGSTKCCFENRAPPNARSEHPIREDAQLFSEHSLVFL